MYLIRHNFIVTINFILRLKFQKMVWIRLVRFVSKHLNTYGKTFIFQNIGTKLTKIMHIRSEQKLTKEN